MQTIAQFWLVAELTPSAFKLGFISTLQYLPLLMFLLVGGALADRLPKRYTLLVTQMLFMVLAFLLFWLVWTERVEYWHVAALAFAFGLVNSLDVPVRQSYTIDLVEGKEHLRNAIATNSAMNNVARIAGPALAGILIVKYGAALVFLLNGLSFIPVIIVLLFIRTEESKKVRSRRMLHEIGEGIGYVLGHRLVFFLLAMLFAIGLFVVNYAVFITELAKDVLKADSETFGYLMSSLGAGALTGAIITASQKKATPQLRLIIVSGLLICCVTMLMYFAEYMWSAMLGLYLIGLFQIMFTADTNTFLQLIVPDMLRGRVMSIYQLLFSGSTPLGALLTGAVIDWLGASYGFLINGGLAFMSIIFLLIWWKVSCSSGASKPPIS